MPSVPEPAPHARDWAEEAKALLARLAGGADRESVEALAMLATGWLGSDGAAAPSRAESRERVLLARRLGERLGGGTILHLGAREGGIAAALAAGGARVWSFLDHPARAIEATLHHGGPQVHFGVRSADTVAVPAPVDLAVVELRIDSRLPRSMDLRDGELGARGPALLLAASARDARGRRSARRDGRGRRWPPS